MGQKLQAYWLKVQEAWPEEHLCAEKQEQK